MRDATATADEQDMSPPLRSFVSSITGSKKASAQAASDLSDQDRNDLAVLERDVEAGVRAADAVEAAGRALVLIRDRQLYRGSHDTFQGYCLLRWNMSARRARQLMVFVEVADDVAAVARDLGTVAPSVSERSTRPLAGLEPQERREAIAEAAASPEGITPATIAKAAEKRRKPKRRAVPRPVRLKVEGGVVIVVLNRRGVAMSKSPADLVDQAAQVLASKAERAA